MVANKDSAVREKSIHPREALLPCLSEVGSPIAAIVSNFAGCPCFGTSAKGA
jgi:hypothetical protein